MSYRKTWQLGELFIHGETSHACPYMDQGDELHRHDLVTLKPNGRPPINFEHDKVSSSTTAPPEEPSTDTQRMGDTLTSEATNASQGFGNIRGSSSVDISPSNGENPTGIELLPRSNGTSLNIENLEKFQSLSSREISPLHVRDLGRIRNLANGSALNVVEPANDLPKPTRGSSPNFCTIELETSAMKIKASERNDSSTPILVIPRRSGNNKEPESSISPTFIYDSFPDNHMTSTGPRIQNDETPKRSIPPTQVRNSSSEAGTAILPDTTRNEAPQESISETEDLEKLTNGDQRQRLRYEAKLHRLYSRTLQTRALVYQKRSELRYLRAEISTADEDFMKLLRERRTQDKPNDLALEGCLRKLQDAREHYGPLEDAYNELEKRLDREEYEITKVENRILKSGVPKPGNHDSDLDSLSSSSDEEHLEILEGIGEGEPNHPLYKEYLSRQGDGDLCREAHLNLVIEYENLLEAEEVRQRHGKEVRLENQTKLAKFPAAEAKILEELKKIEADVERLRVECIREGLFGEAEDEGESDSVSISEESDILKTSNGTVSLEQTEYNKYPLLLQQPDEDDKFSRYLISGFKQDNTGDRITKWLLHKLRSSCSEVELLARYSEGLGPPMDTEKWEQEVLEFWFVDSANLPPSAYQLEPTLTASPPSAFTDPNKVATTRFGDAHLIQLVIRSSSLSRKLELEFSLWLRLARIKGKSAMTV
jgi:hypothetical protein